VKAYYLFVCLNAAAAMVALTAPALILGMMFTMIGIPLAFYLMVAPAITIVLLPAVIVQFVVFPLMSRHRDRLDGGTGILLSILIVLAGNAAIAVPFWRSGKADLDAIVSRDVSAMLTPISGLVGVVTDGGGYYSSLDCLDLCQRLLLSGTADRVVLTWTAEDMEVPLADRQATQWHMERRRVCPGVKLETNADTLIVPGEPERAIGVPKPVDVMNRAISEGNCLIREEGNYGQPDFSILDVNVRLGTAVGHRLALIRHDLTGDVTLAQVTAARSTAIGWLVLPMPEIGMNTQAFDLWRPKMTKNFSGPYDTGPDLATFLTTALGVNLAVITPDDGTATREQLRAVLEAPGPVPDSAEALIASFFRSFQFGTMTDPADQELLLAILGRPEVNLPWYTSTGLPPPSPETVELYDQVADLTLARLPVPKRAFYTGEAIDNLLDRLPAEVIKARSDLVLRLAADPEVRFLNSRIVARLSEVGAAAGPLLIDILRQPPPTSTGDMAYFEREAWSDQRLWAFVALCRGGQIFFDLKPDLQALLDADKVGHMSHIQLTALLRIGFKQGELAARLSPSDSAPTSDLDRAAKEAASDDCER
jgi:hypothetical protein